MLIDLHCHLDSRFFPLNEVEKVVSRARKAGVEIILANGINVKENREVLELSSRFEEIKACLGIHPTDIDKLTDAEIDKEIKFIEANKDKIIAIGEVGLDFKEKGVDKKRQVKVFEKFVKLAIKLDKPIIVHSRKAERECIEILEKLKCGKVVMHCFSGRRSLFSRIIDNGWFVTIPASIKYNAQFQLLAQEMPLDRIFCETDSPFLHPDRKDKNEPCFVVEGYKKIAEIRELSLGEIEKKIEGNYKRLFG